MVNLDPTDKTGSDIKLCLWVSPALLTVGCSEHYPLGIAALPLL